MKYTVKLTRQQALTAACLTVDINFSICINHRVSAAANADFTFFKQKSITFVCGAFHLSSNIHLYQHQHVPEPQSFSIYQSDI